MSASVTAFNAAVSALHEQADEICGMRRAEARGTLTLSAREKTAIVDALRQEVESCERFATVMRLRPLPMSARHDGARRENLWGAPPHGGFTRP
jgi:hypothetical protein